MITTINRSVHTVESSTEISLITSESSMITIMCNINVNIVIMKLIMKLTYSFIEGGDMRCPTPSTVPGVIDL